MTMPRIIRVPILPFHMVNAHLVLGTRGAILVDTGLPGSERRIGRVLSKHGLAFQDIKLIVITHAHVDHAGNAALLRKLCHAPIIGHRSDLPYFTNAAPMTYCPTGWAGRLFARTPVPHERYAGFTPDELLSDSDTFSLRPYGIDGTVHHTSGHTPGSISIELATKEALVGDLIASGVGIGGIMCLGRAIRPPFEDDPYAVGVALQQLLDAGMQHFHMGHGGPLDAREVQRHARALLTLG